MTGKTGLSQNKKTDNKEDMSIFKIELQLIKDISPKKVEIYLAYKGWKKKKEIEGIASIWSKNLPNEEAKILLPLDKDFGDFELKIEEVIEILANVEKRPQLEILKALQSTSTIARNESREIIDFKIQFFEEEKHDAPAKKVGMVLRSLQDFFESLGNSISKNIRRNSRKAVVKDELNLSIVDTFQGSFGIRVGFSKVRQLSLLDNPVSEQAAENFMDLIKASSGDNAQKLREEVQKIQGEPSVKFKYLIKNLMELESDLVLEWGSVNPEKGALVEFPSHKIAEAFDIIAKNELENPIRFELIGKFIVAGVGDKKNSRPFTVYSQEDAKEYKGYISQQVINSLDDNIELDKIYRMIIEETLNINPVTGEELKSYILVELQEIIN